MSRNCLFSELLGLALPAPGQCFPGTFLGWEMGLPIGGRKS